MGIAQQDLDSTEYVFEKDIATLDAEALIATLPYRFFDPHNMDKKIDVKKLQFGSRIDQNSGDREEYFTVKRIIKPDLVELNTGLIVKLLGIIEKPSVNGDATKYLIEKVLGQKVYLRYDEEKYDSKNRLQCYLYLKNRTFINAHLLKAGMVSVDTESDFSQKRKFIELEACYG